MKNIIFMMHIANNGDFVLKKSYNFLYIEES